MRQTAEVGFTSLAQALVSAQDKASHSLASIEGLTALPGWVCGMGGWMEDLLTHRYLWCGYSQWV